MGCKDFLNRWVLPKSLFKDFGAEVGFDDTVGVPGPSQVIVTNLEPGGQHQLARGYPLMSGSYIPQFQMMEAYATSSVGYPIFPEVGFIDTQLLDHSHMTGLSP